MMNKKLCWGLVATKETYMGMFEGQGIDEDFTPNLSSWDPQNLVYMEEGDPHYGAMYCADSNGAIAACRKVYDNLQWNK